MGSPRFSKFYSVHITGRSSYKDKEELSKCLEEIQSGQIIYLDDLSRLGRNMVKIVVEITKLLEQGWHIVVLMEAWTLLNFQMREWSS